jgi:hypothetical protein
MLVATLGLAIPASSASTSPRAVPSSSASASPRTEAAFCAALLTWHPPVFPTKYSVTTYHQWARLLLPFYENLYANAPTTPSKNALNDIVVILTYFEKSATLAQVKAYWLARKSHWTSDFAALVAALKGCVAYFK